MNPENQNNQNESHERPIVLPDTQAAGDNVVSQAETDPTHSVVRNPAEMSEAWDKFKEANPAIAAVPEHIQRPGIFDRIKYATYIVGRFADKALRSETPVAWGSESANKMVAYDQQRKRETEVEKLEQQFDLPAIKPPHEK